MTLLIIAGALVIIVLAVYFAVSASRTPVAVASKAEIEARQLDEGMIVGDPIPIGSADDVGVVTVVPTDADASAEADAFGESTGPVEPLPPRGFTTAGAAPTTASASRTSRTAAANPAGTTDPQSAAADPTAPATADHGAAAAPTPARAAAGDTAGAGAAGRGGPDAGTAKTPRRFDIRWAKRFEAADEPFDDATRLGLLNDLGIVRAPWGVPLLAQAYEEEPEVEHRRAALRSLAAYRHPDTQGTFDVALHSDDEEERTIAEHALTALQIRAALPS